MAVVTGQRSEAVVTAPVPQQSSIRGPHQKAAVVAGLRVETNPQVEGEVLGPTPAIIAGFTHEQSVPSAEWTVVHNLGQKVVPTLVLSSVPDEPVWTDIHFIDDNSLLIQWPSPETGWAYF